MYVDSAFNSIEFNTMNSTFSICFDATCIIYMYLFNLSYKIYAGQ